jgi:hypothetical protein
MSELHQWGELGSPAPPRGMVFVQPTGRTFGVGGRSCGRAVSTPHAPLIELDAATGAVISSGVLAGVPGRSGHAVAVAAAAADTVLVYGGAAVVAGSGDGALLGDAWICSLAKGTAEELAVAAAGGAPAPPPRKWASAASGTAHGRDVVIVFGGVGTVAAAPVAVAAAPAKGAAKGKAAAAVVEAPVAAAPAVSIGGLLPLGDAWVLDVTAKSWSAIPAAASCPRARFHASLTRLPSGALALFGGSDGATDLGDLWLLTPPAAEGGAWTWAEVTDASGAAPLARAGHAAACLPIAGLAAPQLVVFGGHVAAGIAPAALHAYDAGKKSWSVVTVDAGGAAPTPRLGCALAVATYGTGGADAAATATGLLLIDGRCSGDTSAAMWLLTAAAKPPTVRPRAPLRAAGVCLCACWCLLGKVLVQQRVQGPTTCSIHGGTFTGEVDSNGSPQGAGTAVYYDGSQ